MAEHSLLFLVTQFPMEQATRSLLVQVVQQDIHQMVVQVETLQLEPVVLLVQQVQVIRQVLQDG